MQLSAGDGQQAVMQREDAERARGGAAHLAGGDLERLGSQPRRRVHGDDVDIRARDGPR